jgi:cytochrome c-type biogenesis protein CcmH/NrfF
MCVPRRHLLAALVAALTLAAPLAAQTPREQAWDLAHELMSPFCPGKLLAECTSSLAGELREDVAKRIAAGETREAVKADLIRQYGKEILGAPEAEGVGLLAWVLPALLGVLTFGGIGWKIARAARAGQEAALAAPLAATAGADARTLSQLDDELRDLD